MYNFVLHSLDHTDIKLYPDFLFNITTEIFSHANNAGYLTLFWFFTL